MNIPPIVVYVLILSVPPTLTDTNRALLRDVSLTCRPVRIYYHTGDHSGKAGIVPHLGQPHRGTSSHPGPHGLALLLRGHSFLPPQLTAEPYIDVSSTIQSE